MGSLDVPETTIHHGQLIQKKSLLKAVYSKWYGNFMEIAGRLPAGKIVELGSGGGFFSSVCPDVVTSDIIPLPNVDMCFAAQSMPFEDASVAGYFLLNVFHHIPCINDFLAEAERTLVPGGQVVMMEPANTLFSRLVYKNFHHELFDETVSSWTFESKGPLSASNMALPWVVMQRDRYLLSERYPALQVVEYRNEASFAYLLSGGLSLRQLVPNSLTGLVLTFDKILQPVAGMCGLFVWIRISKK